MPGLWTSISTAKQTHSRTLTMSLGKPSVVVFGLAGVLNDLSGELNPSMPELLNWCRDNGVRMAVASNSSRSQATDNFFDETIDSRGEDIPLRDYFECIILQPGSKKNHLSQIQDETGQDYVDMILYDSNSAFSDVEQLGVFFVQVPYGGLDRITFNSGIVWWDQQRFNGN